MEYPLPLNVPEKGIASESTVLDNPPIGAQLYIDKSR